jgi:hypothetical protein
MVGSLTGSQSSAVATECTYNRLSSYAMQSLVHAPLLLCSVILVPETTVNASVAQEFVFKGRRKQKRKNHFTCSCEMQAPPKLGQVRLQVSKWTKHRGTYRGLKLKRMRRLLDSQWHASEHLPEHDTVVQSRAHTVKGCVGRFPVKVFPLFFV